MSENFPVAQEILRQFGGRMFVMMTGATSFAASENSLSFRFKGSKKWKACKVELTPLDVYRVTFYKMRGFDVVSDVHEEVYNDNLREVFERATGLYTSL
jgi:hypothetical protein